MDIRGAAIETATGRSLYGTTSSILIPFGVGSETFSSSRPAAVLDHDLNPRHAYPGPYVVTPRLASVTSGTCRYEWKLPNGDYTQSPEIPVADGACGAAEFDATDIGVHQFWVYVVDDMGRQLAAAAAGVDIDPPMPAPVVEVPAEAEAGTDVAIDASVGAGAPTGYEVEVTPGSSTIAPDNASDETVSISATGPTCSGATGALDPREESGFDHCDLSICLGRAIPGSGQVHGRCRSRTLHHDHGRRPRRRRDPAQRLRRDRRRRGGHGVDERSR